ncbi:amidohydrolase family protein [Corynebacterium sp. zg-331]|uniref:N-acetylglucosamine-6-phosphate deacetylase n=1 Tax=unclassified Corynebacterium TaxID=2624378 RepID=UPI00128B764B|nr:MULTISPECIES: amidohydrolase family protein [unclassified Corynebacterium]MBC3185685.1 amidohydrolase family protein [Corynebacterium sp. zg-331]MPV52178.1 amidohydrolase family protein [Corynebacterium sp. zg331]
MDEFIGRVVTAQHEYPHARLTWADGVIVALEELPGSAPREAATAVPGFVDVHNHGGYRGAFPTGDVQDCLRAARFHRAHGTTTLLASLVSGTQPELTRQVNILRELVEQGEIHGIHLEGPFLSPARCGAQAPDRIQPGDPAMLRGLIEASRGTIRQVTFAPETRRARELVDVCAEYGVVASLGHTQASGECVREILGHARARGVTVSATHLFNAMPPLHHRDPGPVAALLEAAARREAWVEVIADGVHLHDATVDLVAAAVPTRAVAVTDAMEAAGMPDGEYRLGPLRVEVCASVARLRTEGAGQGAIAGGTSTLAQQFWRYRRRHGAVAAVRLTSTNAARLLGLAEEAGDLRPGMPATFAVMDDRGEITGVWHRGVRDGKNEDRQEPII